MVVPGDKTPEFSRRVGCVAFMTAAPAALFLAGCAGQSADRSYPPDIRLIAEVHNAIKREYVDPVEDSRLRQACSDGTRKWSSHHKRVQVPAARQPQPASPPKEPTHVFQWYDPKLSGADAMRMAAACASEMVSIIDREGEFMDREALQEFRGSPSSAFGSLGLDVAGTGDLPVVTAPTPGGPADRAGIRTGDRLWQIDGIALRDVPLSEVRRLLRGKSGSTVRLVILRDGRTEPEMTLTRAAIAGPVAVSSTMLSDGYLHLRIAVFAEGALESVAGLLGSQPGVVAPRGVILDLRNNPGGLLHTCVGVAAAFLQHAARVVELRGRTSQNAKWFHAQPSDYLRGSSSDPLVAMRHRTATIPIAVIVNKGSAACSEIIAAALQDHGRAKIIGSRTFGRGTVQSIMPLSNDAGALKLTTARFYRPNGRVIESVGITPDVVLSEEAHPLPELGDSRDLALRAALSALRDSERRAAHGQFAARRERAVHDHHGHEDAVRRPGVVQENGI